MMSYVDTEKAKEMGIIPCNVFVDGKKVPNCIGFDIEEGYVVSHMVDERGKFVVDGVGGIKNTIIKGKVTYEPIKNT